MLTKSRYLIGAVAAIFATTMVMTDGASARTFQLGGTHSEGAVHKACNDAGGVFSSGGGSYVCVNSCGGGTCSVNCDAKGKCIGHTPARTIPPGGIVGVLLPPRGGNAPPTNASGGPKGKGGLGHVPTAGATQTSGGNQPVTFQRSGGSRSGGGRH